MKKSKLFEKFFPVTAALVSGGGVFFHASSYHGLVLNGALEVAPYFGAFFGLSTVLTGFAGTFYAVVVTSPSEFISKIRNTDAFKSHKSHIKKSMASGFIVSISSIPFMITSFFPSNTYSIGNFLFSMYTFASIYMLASFHRAASSFFIVVDDLPESPSLGG